MPTERRRTIIGVVALVVIQAAAITIYLAVKRSRSEPSQHEFRFETLGGAKRVPNIELERSDGTRIAVSDLPGQIRLLHFWATWCPPCVDELPGLLATSRALNTTGLTLIAISMDRDWDVTRAFFGGDVPPEVYRAVDPNAHSAFDIVSLPDTYLASPDGRLIVRYGGARDWQSRAAVSHLSQKLAWRRGSSP